MAPYAIVALLAALIASIPGYMLPIMYVLGLSITLILAPFVKCWVWGCSNHPGMMGAFLLVAAVWLGVEIGLWSGQLAHWIAGYGA